MDVCLARLLVFECELPKSEASPDGLLCVAKQDDTGLLVLQVLLDQP